jgi:hypothetical protein
VEVYSGRSTPQKRKELGTSEDRLLKVGGPKSRISTIDLALGHSPWSHGLGAERKGIVPENYCRAVKSSERKYLWGFLID